MGRQRDFKHLWGSRWMGLALFLIALVQPACAWSCAFPVSPPARHDAHSASAPARSAPASPPHQAVAHRQAGDRQREQGAPLRCCPEPAQSAHSQTPADADPCSDHHNSPAERHSCCDSHADTFKPAVEAQLDPQSSTSHFPFPSLSAVLPVIAPDDAAADLIPFTRDGARSTLPPLLLASSLLRRGPPVLA